MCNTLIPSTPSHTMTHSTAVYAMIPESLRRYEASPGSRHEAARISVSSGEQNSMAGEHPGGRPKYSDKMVKQMLTYFSSDFCRACIASMFHAEVVEPVPKPVPLAQYCLSDEEVT